MITEGVTVRVEPAPGTSVTVVRYDSLTNTSDVRDGSPPVETLLSGMGVSARVTTSCTLPVRAGFGLSAAAVSAVAVAADALFDLGLTPAQCAAAAHAAEIEHRTGLGDVAAVQGGGRDWRATAGIRAPVKRDFDISSPLAACSFGDLPSPGVLRSPGHMARVVRAFPGRAPGSPVDLLLLSRRFAEASGLITPAVRAALVACDRAGIPASMTMLGNGVFALGPGARQVLSRFGTTHSLHMAAGGVRLLEVRR